MKLQNMMIKIQCYNLQELVNELILAGAEAISINGERITNLSDIT